MKYPISEKCKNAQPVIFHAIREKDLDAITKAIEPGDSQCYLIAPSIGITKKPKVLTKFGDIVFVGTKELLGKNKILVYERDIWSPTMSKIPDKLYAFSPNQLASSVFQSLPTIKQLFKKWGEESIEYGPHNAILDFATSEYEKVWVKLERYLKSRPELACKYGEDVSSFIDDLARGTFVEVPRTRQNITNWFNTEYKGGKDITGKDVFAYAYAIAAPKVPPDKVDEVAGRTLVCNDEVNFEELKDKQWKVINRFRNLARFKETFDVQSLAGEALKGGTYQHFLNEMRFYGVTEADLNSAFADIGGGRGFYGELRDKIIEIPSEYFEGKTLDAIPINDFHEVFVPKGRELLNDKLRKVCKFSGRINEYENPEDIRSMTPD